MKYAKDHANEHGKAHHRLDLKAFALSGSEMMEHDSLSKYERLMQETKGLGADFAVEWVARGALRPGANGQDQVWLHLTVGASVPLTCQRCLGPVDVALSIDRDFRFVGDEKTAETEDDESEEDVLVLSRDFDLQSLIEDELCPGNVKLSVVDPDFEAVAPEKANPFAILAKLQGGKSS